jgi:transposase-like protein
MNSRMNKLTRAQRTQVLTLLCEGMSMRATARATDVSYNTVCTLLEQAGEACAEFHDKTVVSGGEEPRVTGGGHRPAA